MHRLFRTAIGALAALGILAVPALAEAKAQRATVLRVARAHHSIELVDRHHIVRRYIGGRHQLASVERGSVVTFAAHGKRLAKLRVKGRAHRISFYAKVMSTGSHGAVLRLADGRRVRLAAPTAAHARAAGWLSTGIPGLKAGQVVLVTQVEHSNRQAVTVTPVQTTDPDGGEDQDATGVVTDVAADGSSITVKVDGRGPMTFMTDADLVDGVGVGDQVDVTYYTDSDGTLVADDIEPAGDAGSGAPAGDQDATGTVTHLAADGSSLTLLTDGGALQTFATDPDLVDGVGVGDTVDVTYYTDTDGTLVADDVAFAGAGSSTDPGGE